MTHRLDSCAFPFVLKEEIGTKRKDNESVTSNIKKLNKNKKIKQNQKRIDKLVERIKFR